VKPDGGRAGAAVEDEGERSLRAGGEVGALVGGEVDAALHIAGAAANGHEARRRLVLDRLAPEGRGVVFLDPVGLCFGLALKNYGGKEREHERGDYNEFIPKKSKESWLTEVDVISG
jgi:hypothetical protein